MIDTQYLSNPHWLAAGAGFLFNPLDAVMKWYFRNRDRFSELCLVGFLGFLLGFLASAILLLGVLGLHT